IVVEWLLIGLSPWSNPKANPLLMLVFQLGMFSFWSTVAFAPRLFAGRAPSSAATRKTILRFFIPYFLVVYLVAFLVGKPLRFATVIVLIIFGYGLINVFFVSYFRQAFSRRAAAEGA